MTKNLYTTGRIAVLLLGIVLLLLNSTFSAQAQFIVAYVGNGIDGSSGDNGPATAAKISVPTSLVTDGSGNLYINDASNNCIRIVNTSGTITTYAGVGVSGYGGDGGPASAAYLSFNWGVTMDGGGNLFFTDQANSLIRRVSTTGIVTRYAGNASSGYSGDGGPAINAKLQNPRGIAIDRSGNVYLSMDAGLVRKISSAGIISHIAGYPISTTGAALGYSGDGGPANMAQLRNIFGIGCDTMGNLYICDAENNVIRKINTTGIITTVAGNGTAGYAGDGGQATAAKLNHPTGVCVSNSGEIYIADLNNHRVRKINTAGVITTIAGTGVPASGGDNGPAAAATLNRPISVAIDVNDNIYIGEEGGHRVRKIVKSVSFTKGPTQSLSICRDSGPKSINSLLTVQDFSVGLTDTWSLFAAPAHGSVAVSYSITSTGGLLTPTGIYYTPYAGYSGPDVFKIKVSNSSASDIITINVNVSPTTLSAGVITGGASVCVGADITLSSTVAGGTWSSTNDSALETPIAGGKLKVTGNKAPGYDTIWYTVSNACGTASQMQIVAVQPLPTPGLISGATAVCVNSSITLNVSVPGGTWGINNSTVSFIPLVGSSVISGINPGTVVVTYTVTNAWCAAITSHILNVETFPKADAITGPSSVCVGAEITLEDAIATGTCKWTSSNTATATATNFNILTRVLGLIKGISPGVVTINYEISNSCGVDNVYKDVAVHSLPSAPGIIRKDGLLSVSNDYVSYQWMLDGWNIDGATHDTCVVGANGLYAVLVSNVEGCSILSPVYLFSGCDPSELDIFPNPSFSKIFVKWCSMVNARIMAADGRMVGELLNVKEVDMDYLPPGPYIISFFDSKGNKIKSKKVEKLP